MKVRTTAATLGPGGVQVVKGGNLRKLRSPIGHQIATPTTLPDGRRVLRTPTGQMFTSRRIK